MNALASTLTAVGIGIALVGAVPLVCGGVVVAFAQFYVWRPRR